MAETNVSKVMADEKMSKIMKETQEKIDEKKGKRRTLTFLGYFLVIVALLAVLPVVLPPIFGYHTYLSGTDTTGNISKYGSLVYIKEMDAGSFKEGNIVGVVAEDETRTLDSYYVKSSSKSALTLESGKSVSDDVVAGRIVAKTPFMGYLCQLCFSVIGIICIIVIFAAGLAVMMHVNKISKEINQMVEDAKQYA